MSQPNVVLIQSDSMSARALGCIGDRAASTPNLDALARRGVAFANAYCNSPQCVPSRASMWNGRYVHQIGAWNNHKGLDPGDWTFAHGLTDAGYDVSILGRTDHMSGGHTMENRVNAWTRTSGMEPYTRARPTVRVEANDERRFATRDWMRVDEARVHLRRLAGAARPFFCHVGFSLPHQPFVTNRYWKSRIDQDKVVVPPFETELHPVMDYMSRAKNCYAELSTREIIDLRTVYYAMVAELDAMIGEILAEISALGLEDSTYVIYTSDHGEMNMEHRQTFKGCMYDASVRVPLVVAGPGCHHGLVSQELVSLVDVAPTLLDLADSGDRRPPGLSGASILPTLRGDSLDRDLVFAEFHSNAQNTDSYMIFDGRYKFIHYSGFEPQLFDLSVDPEELDNLAERAPDVVDRLAMRLEQTVDWKRVDDEVRAYDVESFVAFRKSQGKDFDDTMRSMYPHWDTGAKEAVQNWLSIAKR